MRICIQNQQSQCMWTHVEFCYAFLYWMHLTLSSKERVTWLDFVSSFFVVETDVNLEAMFRACYV